MYDESKRFAESATHSYITTHNLNGSIARIFNTYGPNMQIDDGRVVTNFIYQALKGKEITIYGNGEQTRCFLWIEDAVTALVNLIDYGGELPDAINVGHPQQISILSLANKFQEFSNADVGIIFSPKLPDEPKHRCPDISLAISMLNWRPTVDLDEIIYRVLDEG